MNITKLIYELEVMATEWADDGDAKEGKILMDAAGLIKQMRDALTPFAGAAERADKASREQERLMGSAISPESSPGWGIKRRHIDAARAAIWQSLDH